MKIAVSGKGGVGKTTLAAFLVKWFAGQGKHVLAIDADPDANLGNGLGIEDASGIIPISEMKDLVAERTESVPGSFGGFFKMNPQVDDLPDKVSNDFSVAKPERIGFTQRLTLCSIVQGRPFISPNEYITKEVNTSEFVDAEQAQGIDIVRNIDERDR